MYGRGFGRMAPVREGEELDVKVDGVGEKGDGIARVEGFVLFIPGVKEGDEVRVRVTKVLSRVGFAEVVGEDSAAEAQEEPEEAAPEETADEATKDEPSETEEEAPMDTTNFGEDL